MANNEAGITEDAKSPKIIRTDMGLAEQHLPSEKIVADRYTRSSTATKSASRGLFQTKLSPPGTV